MNAILGIAEIQLHNEMLSQDSENAFSQILESGDLLMNIINDVLDFSKIEDGKLDLVIVKYDIKNLINSILQLNCLRYESKPLQFNVEVDENTPLEMFGDELRIKQIINNILSNAFKYTDEGTVELKVSAEPSNSDLTGDENVSLIFHISDTGQGMTKTQIEKLFNDFTRFNIFENRTIVGIGLGMSITKRLVDLMNGEITVQSEPGKGSVFTVRILQKKSGSAVFGNECSQIQEASKFHSIITKKTRFVRECMSYGSVLVVDDVESNLFVAKGMLLPYGLNVDTAASGFEAIDKIKDGNIYDIIFMDHMMPKMNGIETVKILREMGYIHCIIAFTANALTGQSHVYLQNGFDGFIPKPIDSRELNQLLIEHLKNKKQLCINDAVNAESKLKTDDVQKFFLLDAEKALNVLNNININNINDEIDSYIITIHGMKTALANVNEKELSGFASKLEQIGRDRDFSVIIGETEKFINQLKDLIEKLKKSAIEKDDKKSNNDKFGDEIILKEKLLVIKEACLALNKKDAKAALNELNSEKWSANIETALNEISALLLHSDFEKAAEITEKLL